MPIINKRTTLGALFIGILIIIVASVLLIQENRQQERETEVEKRETELEIPSCLEIFPRHLKPSPEISPCLEIPSAIALHDQLLAEFLIQQKIIKTGERYSPVGLEFSKVIREDLNRDGEKEIIIGLGFEGPTMGWIGLIKKEKERYLLSYWENLGGDAVLEMSFRNLPLETDQSLIVKKGGRYGTGLFGKSLSIYLIDESRDELLKLIWEGLLEDFGSLGSIGSKGIEAHYNVEFEDIDGDGTLEIIHTGVIKKFQVTEGEYVTLEEGQVRDIFKYNCEYKLHSDCEYKLLSDRELYELLFYREW